uniref:Myosin regulatory light chain 2, smooth muscle isoform n=1 Tax=Salmo salar TaxID=8030 RepID=B9ENW2_SALSA|nr:Myosin regulatory light chain 2, smooth muscle isoform [Salmo salar]
MSSKKTKGAKKRVQRATSNVFAMFDEAQIREFKEAFNLTDQNRDGFIDKDDLRDMYANLGKDIPEQELETMLADAPGPINFTMYLTLFGERLNGTDPEDVIKNAFACMDMDNVGHISEDTLKHYLTTMGDRFTNEEMELALQLAPHDAAGNIVYAKYARAITRGNEEEAD